MNKWMRMAGGEHSTERAVFSVRVFSLHCYINSILRLKRKVTPTQFTKFSWRRVALSFTFAAIFSLSLFIFAEGGIFCAHLLLVKYFCYANANGEKSERGWDRAKEGEKQQKKSRHNNEQCWPNDMMMVYISILIRRHNDIKIDFSILYALL